jgi:threonine/homoserine/homoserine lactone efflux protein
MALETWLGFLLASAAILILPGPTVLLVLSIALSQGRRVALATGAGAVLGGFVTFSATLGGLGAVVLGSAALFTVLKWVGVAYLVWLGLRLILSAPKASLALPAAGGVDLRRGFAHGVAVTALNPKSIAFFIAFVPQFLDPMRSYLTQASVMVPSYVTLAVINVLGYTLLADTLRMRLLRPSVLPWIARMGGISLIGMGMLTATVSRVGP